MSKYTTEVRFICEEYAGLDKSVGYNSIDEVIGKARDKVFDFDFPIFDENYRNTLETKILKHYYTREIGFETTALWKHFLCTRLNEIMPYYNKLYNSELIQFNPMYDVDLTTDYQKVDNGNTDKVSGFNEQSVSNERGGFNEQTVGSSNKNTLATEAGNEKTDYGTVNEQNGTKNKNETSTENTNGVESSSTHSNNQNVPITDRWEYFSDTPEGGINGLEDGDVGHLNYLTTATHITENGTGSTNTTDTTNDSNTSKVASKNAVSTEQDKIDSSEVGTSNRTNDKTTNIGENVIDNANKIGENNKTGDSNKAGSATSNEVINNVEDYLHHVVGKTGGASYSKMLEEYRKTFLNIDMLIINNLSDLFMNLW